jgi:hypothetical protein
MRHRPQTAANVVGIAAQFPATAFMPLDSDVDVYAEHTGQDLCVPKTSSMSCDLGVFVESALVLYKF